MQNNADSVPVPELSGLYTTHTDKECDLSVYKDMKSPTRDLFVNDVYIVEDNNEITLGKRVQLKIDGKNNGPVENIDWGAVNVTLSEQKKSLVMCGRQGKTPSIPK